MDIKELMEILDCTEEEAKSVQEWDEAIDKGKPLGKLDAEKEKISKQARSTAKAPTVYKFDTSKRERKKDEVKHRIMDKIAASLMDIADSLEVTNAEREIVCVVEGRKFKLTLSAPRS
jgi:hypothetical protein